tara:strand:- start:12181 stop:12858 length:678 start_codon:yes stop_codon:yes gene_type:complete
MVYECSSPTERRWFNMRVLRISSVVPVKAVISHEDVTPLKNIEERLRELSELDGLTGIANRRVFETTLEREWLRLARAKSSLSLLMLDIDCFKMLNDTYGHLEGDACIRAVATVMGSVFKRPADLAARFGGEEFVVLLPETEIDQAISLAETLRIRVSELQIPNKNSLVSNTMTVSIGCACISPSSEIKPNELIDLADKALYQAKREGRNRVCRSNIQELGVIDT